MPSQPVRCYPPNLVTECMNGSISVKAGISNGIGVIVEIIVTPICSNQVVHAM